MSNVRNSAFYETAKALTISAIHLIASYLDRGERIPLATVKKGTIRQEGGFQIDDVEEPDLEFLIFTYSEEIKDTPEYYNCSKVMHRDHIISKHLDCCVGSWDVTFRMSAWEYLSHLIERQISQSPQKLKFDSRVFDRAYSDLERFFFNEKIPCKAASPLHNFDADVDKVELGRGLRIRRMEKNELEDVLAESPDPAVDFLSLKYLIEYDYETTKIFGEMPARMMPRPDANPLEEIRKVVTALRLFKAGVVNIGGIKTSQVLDVPTIINRSIYYVHGRYLGQKYELKSAEKTDFECFWNTFSKINLESLDFLGVALRRFNYAYERSSLEDKLIDFMVAFEALFFKQGEFGELGHKLAVRVSRLLEQNYDKRKLISKKLSDFYEKRSKVVHGEKVELKEDFVADIEDHLRRSIKLFLNRMQVSNHEEIISHLDLD